MKNRISWEVLALLFFCLVLGCFSILDEDLAGSDEPRVAGIAREMNLDGEYLLPKLNGKPFLEYPSLGYVPVSVFLSFSEKPSDLLAHLPGILFGMATLVLTYCLGSLVGNRRTGLTSGAALLATVGFMNIQNKCLVDPPLMFFISLSLYGFFNLYKSSNRPAVHAIYFYSGMAAAFLTKGLIGIFLPAAIVLVFLTAKKDWRSLSRLHLQLGILLFVLPIAIWAGVVWKTHGGEVVHEFFHQSVWRFFSPTADHSEPFYFYLPLLLYLLLPWTLLSLVLLGMRFGKRKWNDALKLPEGGQFPLTWAIVVVFCLSLASAKRYIYLAPLYPGVAVLAALYWDKFRQKLNIPTNVELVLLGMWLSFFLLAEEIVLDNYNQSENIRPLYEKISPEDRVELFRPSETLSGATVFYLGHTVPSHQSAESLNSSRKSGGKEITILSLQRENEALQEAVGANNLSLVGSWTSGRRSYQIHRIKAQ